MPSNFRLLVGSALALALTTMSPRAATAAPPEPTTRAASPSLELRVGAGCLDTNAGERIRDQLEAQLREQLESEGLSLVDKGGDGIVELRVALVELGNYVVNVDLVVGSRRQTLVEAAECTTCNEARVASFIAELLDGAGVGELLAKLQPPAEEEPVEPEAPPRAGLLIGPWGLAGAVTSSVGVGALVASGFMFQRSSGLELSKPRAPAEASIWLVASAATVALGAVAITIDQVTIRQRPTRRVIELSAALRLDGAALIVRGRF